MYRAAGRGVRDLERRHGALGPERSHVQDEAPVLQHWADEVQGHEPASCRGGAGDADHRRDGAEGRHSVCVDLPDQVPLAGEDTARPAVRWLNSAAALAEPAAHSAGPAVMLPPTVSTVTAAPSCSASCPAFGAARFTSSAPAQCPSTTYVHASTAGPHASTARTRMCSTSERSRPPASIPTTVPVTSRGGRRSGWCRTTGPATDPRCRARRPWGPQGRPTRREDRGPTACRRYPAAADRTGPCPP